MNSDTPTLEAIEVIYRRRGADYFRFALARTGDREIARDAVQEGFARAIRARATVRESSSLEAWVCRCVLNAAIDATQPLSSATPVSGPEPEEDQSEPDHAVRSALRALPPRQRDVVFLRFYLGFDYAAIADTLGIKVGTVSATLHTAHANLRRALTEEVKQ
jgi:RNA polymerase sigma factor (sigma-70 family)